MFAGWLALLLLCALPPLAMAAKTEAQGGPAVRAQRIVSINPSLTAILLAIGAADTLVGVDDYSAGIRSEVAHLPRVGGLFSPSLEAVVALRPDLVVLVPSTEQRDFRRRLEELGIAVSVFDNIRFDEVLENIERLGDLTDHRAGARRRVEAIERTRAAASKAAAARTSPRVLVVIQRDPVFIVGAGSFISEMLATLGARNLGEAFQDPYPRVAVEWVIARAPDVLIDLSRDPEPPETYWARWPSIPAVARSRVLRLDPQLISMPGPDLDRSLELLGEGLYGADFVDEIRRARAR